MRTGEGIREPSDNPQDLFRGVVLRQSCSICKQPFPLDDEHFDFCPRCGRLVCKDKCARTCPFCFVTRCVLCLEEIHKSTSGSACEKCAPALCRGERR